MTHQILLLGTERQSRTATTCVQIDRQMVNICKYCSAEFASRNAVFRHLQSSEECYRKAQQAAEENGTILSIKNSIQLKKRKVAINFGFHSPSLLQDGRFSYTNNNEVAAEIVRTSFFLALKQLYPATPVEKGDGGATFTQASAAQLRHPSLAQEKSCSAGYDVLGITYRGGPREIDPEKLVPMMQEIVLKDHDLLDSINNESRDISRVEVLNIQSLIVSSKFHAEKSCSQLAYQYVMPIKWLDESQETLDWIRQTLVDDDGHQLKRRKTPQCLQKLKKVLKLMESRDITDDSSLLVSSAGRFGKLAQKEKQPLHNFCDPSLGVFASPSNEHVWRSIDKARLSGFLIHSEDENEDNDKDKDEAFVVIEFRGDGFVVEQVRRMVASAVAISNEWLPTDYLNIAMRPDITLETPIAPAGLLYLSSARYHFLDLVQGSTLFEDSSTRSKQWIYSLQSSMLKERSTNYRSEIAWLEDLKSIISPRIQRALSQIVTDDALREDRILRKNAEDSRQVVIEQNDDKSVHEAPEAYWNALSLLQSICEEKLWPRTPDPKSRIIRQPNLFGTEAKDFHQQGALSQFYGHLLQCGSFTVTNPNSFEGPGPSANGLFPGLVKAIFELEAYCSTDSSILCLGNEQEETKSFFSPSTHCTVNRNIEYTPHFDSGRGKDQTYSMIVGLGDYTGGALVVNGDPYDIRYKPLKYDGWNQIHSTKPFSGERFSLVWFTPEVRGEKSNFEDTKAKGLVDAHMSSYSLSNFPIIQFRPNSTDALVIGEILDTKEGCTYELSTEAWASMSKNELETCKDRFSIKGHNSVLDIGAHIGIFCRYALSAGCSKIIAYEPELENLKILRQNLGIVHDSTIYREKIEINDYAVAHGEPSTRSLILARNKTDGSLNTWRHSLEEYSHYVDKKESSLTSKNQDGILSRAQVKTIPFFGDGGALVPGVTFVKIDCEGAEIDILSSKEASQSSSWRDVTHLVFEWSFTKERRVSAFHKAVSNINAAGFDVVYEGQNSWWDIDHNCMWPYHSDLVVYAKRRSIKSDDLLARDVSTGSEKKNF